MKLSHTIKFPSGQRYEMKEFSMEVDDAEFPELAGRSIVERTRYLQGTLLQMGLIFQLATGYLSPEEDAFKERMRLALELKKLPPQKTRKVPSRV
jgi:hypothetical protein